MEVGLVSEENRDVEVRRKENFGNFGKFFLWLRVARCHVPHRPPKAEPRKKSYSTTTTTANYMRVKHCRADVTGKG